MAAIVAAIAAIAVVALVVSGGLNRTPPPSAPVLAFSRVTTQQGLEQSPSLSPDGKWVVYSSGGDLFLQSVGAQTAINLTKDSPAEDLQPSFSADGERIIFFSSRDGGGLFVMGRTGESVRRVADAGFNPKWSPDGKEIVFATEPISGEPHNRATRTSELWAVNIATGAKRKVSPGDAVQPSWSPHGTRIAYWRIRIPGRSIGQRDIWTMPAAGGEPTPVTDDAALDWSPVWSGDGKYLYFASDRAGTMNLWRVAIDEASGKVLGGLEPVTTPAAFLGNFSFSADGARIAFESRMIDSNVRKAMFDPAAEIIRGEPVTVTGGSRSWVYIDVSPDGQRLVLAPQYMQEDIYIAKADGTDVRQLTDDEARDRMPKWSSDGNTIVFYSDRESGRYHLWTIRPDGSGLKQLSFQEGGGYYPTTSASGHRVAATQAVNQGGGFYLFDALKPWKEQTVEVVKTPAEGFRAWSWSRDGRRILGQFDRGSREGGGLMLYDVDTRSFERLRPTGASPRWLKDDRRFVFFDNDQLILMDAQSKRTKVLWSARRGMMRSFGISPDDQAIYVVPIITDGDIWMATFGAQPGAGK